MSKQEINIFHNDIKGLKLSQNKYIDEVFDLLEDDFVNIIEIGTCFGGFAVFLKEHFKSANIHTFDVVDWGDIDYVLHRNNIYKELGINYHKEDCFLRNGRRIKNLLKSKSILLCDGAHKENEFNFFSKFITKGSIIMAHDYGKNEPYFRKNIEGKYWNASFEFDGSKFTRLCNERKLIPYHQDKFEKAVWFIRKQA
jgi:hypothetical protein